MDFSKPSPVVAVVGVCLLSAGVALVGWYAAANAVYRASQRT
jgi:hypothetical protein